MPRQPSVRYFSSRQAYSCQFRSKQHLLASGPDDYPDGPTYKAAVKAFGQLMTIAGREATMLVAAGSLTCPSENRNRFFLFQEGSKLVNDGQGLLRGCGHAPVENWEANELDAVGSA
jgi:hypothetical protein